MSRRYAARFAWVLWGISLLSLWLGLFIDQFNPPVPQSTSAQVAFVILHLAFATVGAVVAARRPTNPIGWLFSAVALSLAVLWFSTAYARYALLTNPGALPGGAAMAWLQSWTWYPVIGLLGTFVLLLFPDGRLPSPRWRFVAWLAASTIALLVIAQAFQAEIVLGQDGWNLPRVDNPIGIESARVQRLLDLLLTAASVALIPAVLLSMASIVIRYRRAGAEERLQLKWFTYSAALLVILNLLAALLEPYLPNVVDGDLFFALLACLPPISAGIAILRYRLYDIDIIIRRTLIYSLLTAALLVVYLGSVVLLQQLFRALVGQSNQLSIVISTLAIAALFNPLRQRIQEFIDRRFYRRKYDAQQTLAAFGQTVRNEVELEQLTGELLRVIEETMQPAHVSLWLREVGRGKDEGTARGAGSGERGAEG